MDPAPGLAGTFNVEHHPGPSRVTALVDGPLKVARTRRTLAARRGAIECVLDGFVSNAEDLAASLDLPAGGVDAAAVVAAGYRRLGEAVLGRLRGDFVCVVWDREARRGLIARDQLGGRSVYLRREGRGLLFASEVRELLGMLPRTPPPDRTVLLHWLSMIHHVGAETPFEGVEALLPGQVARLGPDGVELARYWTPRYREPRERTREEAVAELRSDFDRALDRTIAGCGEVGVMMSGGLDSTSIAMFADRRPVGVTGYAAVFPGMPFVDESDYIDQIVEASALPVRRIAIHGGSMLRSALRFSRDWHLPLASQNLEFWLPLVRRGVDDGVDVMLDGEGGDLLFAARPELVGDRLRQGRLLSAVGLVRSLPGSAQASPRALASVVLARGGGAALPPGLHDAVHRRGAGRHTPRWLSSADGRHVVETDHEYAWKRLDGPRWWARLADALTNGLHAVGIRDHQRRLSLMAGVETRSPYFDVDLAERALAMPPELAFDPQLSRPLQRDIAAGALTDSVRLRPNKSYFDELFYKSFAVEDGAAVTQLLTAPDAALRAWVDLEVVRTALLEPGPRSSGVGIRYWMKSVWRLAAAECWLRELADPGSADAAIERLGLAAPRIEFTGASSSSRPARA